MEINIDPGSQEVKLAQKLASCEPKLRCRAIVELRKWMRGRIKGNHVFSREDFLKLWKGLYYCMWMQDKPLLQEDLAEKICGLIACFGEKHQQVLLYLDTFLETMSREWPGIDKWRIDKYFHLIRVFMRHILAWLKQKNWDHCLMENTVEVWKKTVMSTIPNVCADSLKFHFAAIYLDELDNAGKGDQQFSDEHLNFFLNCYLDLLTAKISSPFFHTIVAEIFETILVQFSEEKDAEEDEIKDKEGIKFDYKYIGEQLFDIGKGSGLKSDRRKKIYTLVKKFQLAASGEDPLECEDESDIEEVAPLKTKRIKRAARSLVQKQGKGDVERKKWKKERKQLKRDEDERETMNFDFAGDNVLQKNAGFVPEESLNFKERVKRIKPLEKKGKAKRKKQQVDA